MAHKYVHNGTTGGPATMGRPRQPDLSHGFKTAAATAAQAKQTCFLLSHFLVQSELLAGVGSGGN